MLTEKFVTTRLALESAMTALIERHADMITFFEDELEVMTLSKAIDTMDFEDWVEDHLRPAIVKTGNPAYEAACDDLIVTQQFICESNLGI